MIVIGENKIKGLVLVFDSVWSWVGTVLRWIIMIINNRNDEKKIKKMASHDVRLSQSVGMQPSQFVLVGSNWDGWDV